MAYIQHNWAGPLDVIYTWACAEHTGQDGTRQVHDHGRLETRVIYALFGQDEFRDIRDVGNGELWIPAWWEIYRISDIQGDIVQRSRFGGTGSGFYLPEKAWTKAAGESDVLATGSLGEVLVLPIADANQLKIGDSIYPMVRARVLDGSFQWHTTTAVEGSVELQIVDEYVPKIGSKSASDIAMPNRVTPLDHSWNVYRSDISGASGYTRRVGFHAPRRVIKNEYLLIDNQIDEFLQFFMTMRGRAGTDTFEYYHDGGGDFVGRLAGDTMTISYVTPHVATATLIVEEV